ncbi:MAG: GntR family transcriptional regulator [Bacteroidetes bacterium]|nr:GntR family transcriptional regulator [Bacteroidota bacterium]
MDFKQPKAIYIQIADYLLDNILSGQIKPGDKISSVRELASEVQVNPNTVVRTFSFLQDKEIIYNQRGIGYFVTDDGLSKTRALRKERFFEQFLPDVFKSMDLLEISMDEVVVRYKNSIA